MILHVLDIAGLVSRHFAIFHDLNVQVFGPNVQEVIFAPPQLKGSQSPGLSRSVVVV